MSDEKLKLHNTIDGIPEEWVKKILEYIEILRKNDEELNVPDRLVVKNEDELSQKLTEAIESEEAIPLSEVINRMSKVVTD
ncbi:MAG: hypothetical protein IJS47_03890 [Clostridia bacterium]|nr:hypothetical protein [Clostridia bacterium]